MGICNKDILLVIIVICLLYLFYKDNIRKEGFQSTATGYQGDIEAIRNLSNIATQLTTNNTLTMPGVLKTVNTISVDTGSVGNTNKGFIETNYGDLGDRYGIGQDGNGSMRLYTATKHAPASACLSLAKSDGKFNDIVKVTTDGNTSIAGNTVIGGKLILPNNTQLSADGDDATHWLRLQQASNPNQYKSFAALDLWCAAGNLYSGTIHNGGDIYTNRLMSRQNLAKFIRIGNKFAGELFQPYWCVLEVRVYPVTDLTNNIAINKPVAVLEGAPSQNTPAGNITNGKIFNNKSELGDHWYNGYVGGAGVNVLQIDLQNEFWISQIEVFNRFSDRDDLRMNGTTIELLKADGSLSRVIYTGNWHRQYSRTFLL
jgi:hypothetical protein